MDKIYNDLVLLTVTDKGDYLEVDISIELEGDPVESLDARRDKAIRTAKSEMIVMMHKYPESVGEKKDIEPLHPNSRVIQTQYKIYKNEEARRKDTK